MFIRRPTIGRYAAFRTAFRGRYRSRSPVRRVRARSPPPASIEGLVEEPVDSDSLDSEDSVSKEPVDSDSLDYVNEDRVDSDYLDSADSVNGEVFVFSNRKLRKEWDGQLIVNINQYQSKEVNKMNYLKTSLLMGLRSMGIKNLSPLQMSIVNSAVRHGPFQNDLYVSTPEGRGLRLGYAIPIVESVTKENGLQALVLVCCRSLALKVRSIFLQLTCYMEISVGIAAPSVPSSEECDCIVDDRESTSDMLTEKSAVPISLCQVLICTLEALMKNEVDLGELKYLVIDDMEHLLRENQSEENEFISRLPTKLIVAKIVTSQLNVTDLTNLNGLGLKNPKVLLTKPFAGGMWP